MVYIM